MSEKYEAVYRISLAFMLIDNTINENEKKVVLDFLSSKFGQAIPKDRQNIAYHKEKMGFENFRKDTLIAYEGFYREELYDVLDFIGKMIKSDGNADSKEIMLFEILLENWKIDKTIMNTLGIKKNLWSKFFN